MISRIVFALAIFAPQMMAQAKTVLYAAVGNELRQYDVDSQSVTLTPRSSVTLPAQVQEAWPSASRRFLYVAWSNGGAANASADGISPRGDQHGISAFQINPATGALTTHGKPAPLPSRPIFITTDTSGAHIIAAYNDPSQLTVNRILADGTLGEQIPQAKQLDFGIYGHQVRADPSGKTIIMMTRGNGPTAAKAEDPGAIKIFDYKDGVLRNLQSIAPGGGFGFQVRHLDFDPSGKWVFVTLERQNQLQVYRRHPDGTLDPGPLFTKSALMPATGSASTQTAASIHVHPTGKFLYVANRASDNQGFVAGGENSIAVFSINPATGEPALVQSIGTGGFQPRTFALDAAAGVLVVGNQSPQTVVGLNNTTTVPASIALFRLRDDGRLDPGQNYEVATSPGRILFWVGLVRLP
jgi:6-phosphogluconolactonase (cycloisomerase 2 family)